MRKSREAKPGTSEELEKFVTRRKGLLARSRVVEGRVLVIFCDRGLKSI